MWGNGTDGGVIKDVPGGASSKESYFIVSLAAIVIDNSFVVITLLLWRPLLECNQYFITSP